MAPNADGTATPEEQAEIEAKMRAPKDVIDPQTKAEYDARYAELQAKVTKETAAREASEQARLEAEAKVLAMQAGAVPSSRARQMPLWYVLKADHATASGDIKVIVDDMNKDLKDVPGYKPLTPAEFLALNAEVLDADAKARGFDRGARYAVAAEDGSIASGYHIFAGASVLAGLRSPSGTVKATVTTK